MKRETYVGHLNNRGEWHSIDGQMPGQGAGNLPAQVENGIQQEGIKYEEIQDEPTASTESLDGEDVYFSSGNPVSLPLVEGVEDSGKDEESAPKSESDDDAFRTKENEPIAPKFEDAFSTKEPPVFSTKEKPNLRLIFSTKNEPQNEDQITLINSNDSQWKHIKSKPPYPPKHALNPSGKKQIGRRVAVGYEILRRAKCEDCGKEMRLTAGYIGATQLLGLERESNETKIGIVKNILRKKARDVDERLINLRCTGCCLGSEGGSISAIGA